MKYLAYIILIGSFFACSSKTKVPKNILSQQEMNLVMWDLMRADEYTETYIMKDSSLNKKAETQKLYNQIFSLHGISNEKFQTSINFYQSRPDLLKQIIDSLRRNERRAIDERIIDEKTSSISVNVKKKIKAKQAN
ncbi:MAG: DUF4296 domain-containing protein [Chitinophagaceae bacterium]|nr:MAG: DUF4296 domain-containing protein [Chitinophagaceae bacterium]